MTDPMKTASERLDELLGSAEGGGAQLPDDIMQTALNLANELLDRGLGDEVRYAEAIARALIAERAKAEAYKEYAEFWRDMIGAPIAIIEARAEKRGAEQERERCAKVAERIHLQDEIDNGAAATGAAHAVVAAIRGGAHDS